MSAVTQYLQGRGVEFWTLNHPRAFTTADEATALGVTPDRIAKTLVLDTDTGHALAVIPGDRRLDKELLEGVAGPHARLASEDEIANDFPQFELGAIPPLGALLEVTAYVDPDVGFHEDVVFAGGSQTESIEMHSRDLLSDRYTTIARLSRTPTFDEEWME